MKKKRKEFNKKAGIGLAAGIVAGAAIGTAAGVLLTPKSGKETRTDIKEKANDVIENVKVKVSKLKKNTSPEKDSENDSENIES